MLNSENQAQGNTEAFQRCEWSCAGAEMYLRDVSSYGLAQDASTQVTFQQVAEAARQQKETALGYLLQDGTVITAPNAGQKRVLHTGDRIIALADQA